MRISIRSTWSRPIGVLLDGISGHEHYNGGRITVGPDGPLHATTGWVHDGSARTVQTLEDIVRPRYGAATDDAAVPD